MIHESPRIAAACASRDVDLGALLENSEEVILFGSQAGKMAGPGSDVDLLCVGRGWNIRSRALDLLWLDPGEVRGSAWLGSELAAHVVRHGLWLKGAGDWRRGARVSSEAIAGKRRVIRERALALTASWDRVATPYRGRHIARLRQDLQRLECLTAGEGCPSTPRLDALWRAQPSGTARVLQLARSAGDEVRSALERLLRLAGPGVFDPGSPSARGPGGA